MDSPTFVPVLALPDGITDIDFYVNAFGATQEWRINNDDGSVHVAEFTIDGTKFQLHEDNPAAEVNCPQRFNSVSLTIGLMVNDPDAFVSRAVAGGARLISPVQDYEYGYREGKIADPFGHQWAIEKITDKEAIKLFLNKQDN